MKAFSIRLRSEDDTVRLGDMIGRILADRHPGSGMVLALTGELGAGKTTLTRGLARGLGVPPDQPIVSPTFTLANEYAGRIPLYHLDLYRLERDDFYDSGLDDYLHRPGVTVIEWAEKLEDDLPDARLELNLKYAPDGRIADILAHNPESEEIIARITALWTPAPAPPERLPR